MNNNIWTVMRKEFARFFGDKRMVFSVILMPGLLIYLLYSFMGSAMTSSFFTADDYRCQVAVVNLPASVSSIFDSGELPVDLYPTTDNLAVYQQQITDQSLDLLAVFPEDFDSSILVYDPLTAVGPAPNVELYYNSARSESTDAYSLFTAVLDAYESALANKFDINRDSAGATYDLASDRDNAAQIFAMMLPLLMMTFLFSACTAIAPESIAGEKERGTIATLLVTPLKRSSLAIGKICSLSAIALLGGLSSFLGTMLSLPKLMGGMPGMSASVYGPNEYAALLVIILSTVLVMISGISVISAFAKTVKEASTLVVPLMILVMLTGVSGMLGGGPAKNLALYLIPIYNSVQCMSGIFSFSCTIPQIAVSAAVNLLCVAILVTVLTKMFDSEKIMYT